LKRLLILAAVLLPSCATPALVLPKADFIPEQIVPNPDNNVRAFRIDIEEFNRLEPKARYTLSPIPIDEHGLIPTQHPIEFFAFPRNYTNIFLVRVYRPGFLTIEIKPGDDTRRPPWIRADRFEQEMAIDVLLGIERRFGNEGWESGETKPRSEILNLGSSSVRNSWKTLGDYGLQPGTVSQLHRDVLLFAASEYARLATVSNENEARQRLERKAAQIRRYADELTTEEFYRKQSDANSRLP
jgi:hypothetical protein